MAQDGADGLFHQRAEHRQVLLADDFDVVDALVDIAGDEGSLARALVLSGPPSGVGGGRSTVYLHYICRQRHPSKELGRLCNGMFFLHVLARQVGGQEGVVFPLVDVSLAQQAVGVVAEIEFVDAGHAVLPQ